MAIDSITYQGIEYIPEHCKKTNTTRIQKNCNRVECLQKLKRYNVAE